MGEIKRGERGEEDEMWEGGKKRRGEGRNKGEKGGGDLEGGR